MARKFLTPIDLGKLELQNAAIQNLASAPASPVKGQLYFNTTDSTLYWCANNVGPVWVAAKDAGATSVFYQTIKDGGTARIQRNNVNYVDTAGNTITATDDAANDETEITVDTVFAAVTAQTTFGLASGNGSSAASARSDHTHGTPVHDAAAHSTIPISALAAATGPINMGGFGITNVGGPSAGTDAATKTYVDNLATGMSWKNAVRAASTATVTLASGAQNGSVIDGVTLATGDRILLKNQSAGAENGIYTVNASGAPTRATDADTGTELVNAAVFAAEGTANADTAWVQTTSPITVGTTAQTWVQFSGAGAITAGSGLTSSGTTINVGAGTGITVNADDVAISTNGVTNTLAADMATQTIKGNNTGSTADPKDLTATEVTAMLNLFTATLKGLVPPPTTATGKFLKDDGTWATAGTINKFAVGCNAATATVVTHNLNSQDVTVAVYLNSGTFEEVDCDIEHTSVNTCTVRFATAPAANAYRIVVVG